MIKRILKFFTLKNTILTFLFLLLFFLLRWNCFSTPFERDEGTYAYSAWLMRNGGVPYKDTFMQKPPMIIYTYFIGQIISPSGLWTSRFIAAIFTLITTFLLALIAKKEFGEKAFWVTAFVFTPIVISPINSGLAANTEIFMILPLTGVLYLYVFFKDRMDFKNWFLSGVLSSISILYKPIALYVIVYIYLAWFYSLIKGKAGIKIYLKFILAILISGTITAFIAILPFLIKGAGRNFWEEVIVFNGFYVKQWGYSLSPFIANLRLMFKSFWFIYLTFIAFFFIKSEKRLFYAGLMLFSILASYQTPMRHYFILFMPYIALISTFVILWVSDKSIVKRYSGKSAYIVITTFVVLTVIWPLRAQFSLTPRDLNLWIYGTENPFYEAPLIADKLESITTPTDHVLVAGSEPEILYYAQRKNSSRFDITYPLIIDTPLREKYQKEAIEELKKYPPKAIVYSTRQLSGLWNQESPRLFIDYLNGLINKKYKLIGGYVWGASGGYWSENLTKSELQNSSLLLYKKI